MSLLRALARRAGLCAATLALVSLVSESACAQAIGRLSGFVYVDRNNDGHLAFNDEALPELVMSGVEIKLFNLATSTTVPIATVVTDNIGQYLFAGLASGAYRIAQTQPIGYLDGLDTLGEMRNAAGNSVTSGLGVVQPDAFADIQLTTGARGAMYNFGERGLLPGFVSKRYLLGTAPRPVFTPPDPIFFENVPEPTGGALAATATGLLLARKRRLRCAAPT